jgi:uroporphyrinogen decarboxylase
MPYTARVFAEVRSLGAPTIHFGTGTAGLLDLMARAGGDVISVDWRINLDEAWERVGYDRGIQGNLDPAMLLAPFAVVEDGVRDVLRRAGGRRGHIFNLGHGVLPATEPDDLRHLVEIVHEASAAR